MHARPSLSFSVSLLLPTYCLVPSHPPIEGVHVHVSLGKFLFVYPIHKENFDQSMSIANAKAQNTIRCADREIASSVAKSKRKMPMVKELSVFLGSVLLY